MGCWNHPDKLCVVLHKIDRQADERASKNMQELFWQIDCARCFLTGVECWGYTCCMEGEVVVLPWFKGNLSGCLDAVVARWFEESESASWLRPYAVSRTAQFGCVSSCGQQKFLEVRMMDLMDPPSRKLIRVALGRSLLASPWIF